MSTDPTGLRPSPEAAGAPAAPQATRARDSDDSRDGGSGPRRERREQAPAEPGRGGRSPRRGRKVRKVHRVVRHLDVWSVAKVAAIFAACAYVVGMISGYLLWQAADRVGTIDGIEGFFEDAGGYDTFELLGDVVFRVAAIAGLLLAGLLVFVVVLGALLFNLISDLTGGIRLTVIDEDLIVAPARRRPEAAAGAPQTAAARTSPPRSPEPSPAPSAPAASGSPAAAADATAAYQADR
ncbi:MAG TPA: DUF3566 domain-containing protein [Acidimicrobiales bacterium]|nr:DUF3566 domain-containing protein [Acidimicrobiales bacterium]